VLSYASGMDEPREVPAIGPGEHPELHAVAGVDHAEDQVKRLLAFRDRHPEITVTSPRETLTGEWIASWSVPVTGPGEPLIEMATHSDLRWLMDYLEARFG
jgi:hypothetical protein